MTIEVRDPRTGAIDVRFEPTPDEELSRLAEEMRVAQPTWEEFTIEARTTALRAWAEAIAARRPDIVDALLRDTGRLIESQLEVDAVLRSIERWCTIAPELLEPQQPSPSSVPTIDLGQAMRPYPLVGVISPWNFPMLLSLIDAIPALAAGCAVIIKPSEVTPRFIEPVTASIADAPELAHVLAYVGGAGETGSALVDLVDAVCFTGSVPTGRKVGEQAARRFIPAFLELGGKDPAVVLASADLDRASSAILWSATANAGQACQSIERVYVERPASDELISRLVEKASALRLAAPRVEDGEIGPIIAEKQIAVIEDHLADALAKGAKVHCGGEIERIEGGAYCRPTVLTEVDHSMKVMTEETFGPIVPVMAVDDVDDAVHLANDTIYGLSGAVFAGSAEAALAVANRLNAGGISVNDAHLTAICYDGEKNSFNLSGLGSSRMGPAALRRFGRRQAFLVSRNPGPDPWWFPSLRDEAGSPGTP